MRKWLFLVVALVFLSQHTGFGWGLTGHVVITRAAIGALPADVPGFVKRQIDWIGARSITPDSYRAASEPFIKMAEDPSHEWHVEQVAFLKTIPRSRVEFIQALYDDYDQTGAFAVASLLTFLALVTIALKAWVEHKSMIVDDKGTSA